MSGDPPGAHQPWNDEGTGYSGPPPVTNEKKIAYAASGKTDGVIIYELLTQIAGCTNVENPLPEMGLVLGQVQPVALPTGQSPKALIDLIDMITWMRTIESADGTITRVPYTVTPSSGASRVLTYGVDLFRGKRRRTREGAYANVIVTGISGLGNDGISTYTVEYQSDLPVDEELGLIDTHPFDSELIETYEVARDWGQTFLGNFGRVQESLEFELLDGDSTIRSGMTIALVVPHWGIGADSRWLITEVSHNYPEKGPFITNIVLRGSATPTGGDSNMPPVPILSAFYDLEYLNGQRRIIGIFDASQSYDPDGVVVTYEWSTSEGDLYVLENGKRAVVVYGAAEPTLTATVTLEIGDDQGLHTTKVFPVRPEVGKNLLVRDLWYADGVDAYLTINGCRTWNPVGVAGAIGVCEVASKEYNLVWTAAEAYKVTTQVVPELIPELSNVLDMSISLDPNGLETGATWAGCEDGSVWRSDVNGDPGTWAQTNTTLLPFGVLYVSESPFAVGTVQVLSANALWLSFDNGVTFTKVYEYPFPGANATWFTSGMVGTTEDSVVSAGFISFAGDYEAGQDQFVIQRPTDELPSEFAFPGDDMPVQIRAVSLEVDGSELYALGEDASHEGGAWAVAPDADGTFVRRFWDHDRSGRPRHGIRDPKFLGIFYYAAELELGKGFMGFTSTAQIRDAADTGGSPSRVGYGNVHPLEITGALLWVGVNNQFSLAEPKINALTAGGVERRSDYPNPAYGTTAAARIPLLYVGLGMIVTWTSAGGGGTDKTRPVNGPDNLYRSADGGFTWDLCDVPHVSDVATDGAGRVYAISYGPANNQTGGGLFRSDDAGVTWDQVSTFPIAGTGAHTGVAPSAVACNPLDPDDVIIRLNAIVRSADGGSTWDIIDDFGGTGEVSGFGTYDVQAYNVEGTHIVYRMGGAVPGGGLWLLPVTGLPRVLASASVGGSVAFASNGEKQLMYGSDPPIISEDNGFSWSSLPGGISSYGAVVGDSVNPWYLLATTIMRYIGSDPTADGWQDITASVLAGLPDTSYICPVEGAIRLPDQEA